MDYITFYKESFCASRIGLVELRDEKKEEMSALLKEDAKPTFCLEALWARGAIFSRHIDHHHSDVIGSIRL